MAVCGVVKFSELGSGKLVGSRKGSWLPEDNLPEARRAILAEDRKKILKRADKQRADMQKNLIKTAEIDEYLKTLI